MIKKMLKVVSRLLIISVFFYFFIERKEIFYFSDIVSPYLSLGFLIIAAVLTGELSRLLGLPALTGYLIAGIIFGPQALNFVNEKDIETLEFINSIALTFIAIAAGGKLKIESLKKNIKPMTIILFFQTAIIFSVISFVFYLLLSKGVFIKLSSSEAVLFFSLFLGVIAVSKSPATTIAVINEYNAKGEFTDIVLGTTMIKDVVVLLLFSVVMAFAKNSIAGVSFSWKFLFSIFSHLFVSGALGVVLGLLIIMFFKYVAREISVFIVLVSFLSFHFASSAELEFMFLCIVAGFVVQNFSKQGKVLLDAIESSHLPIFVIFFSIAGGGLDFSYLKLYFSVVFIFVVLRLILIYLSTFLGAKTAKAPESVRKYGWLGFVTNAGLTLSLVILIEKAFPDFGIILKAVILSVIAINLIAGPIMFKYSLLKAGEIEEKQIKT